MGQAPRYRTKNMATSIGLERLEAVLATYVGTNRLVRVPLGGTASLNYFGRIDMQMDPNDDPQFLLRRDENPGVFFVFYIQDVQVIQNPDDPKKTIIWLKNNIDKKESVE